MFFIRCSPIRQHNLHVPSYKLAVLGTIGRMAGSEACHVCRKCATHHRIPHAIFRRLGDRSIHRLHSIGCRQRFDGVAGTAICGRNIVSFICRISFCRHWMFFLFREPSLRGILTAASSICVNLGLLTTLFLGSLMSSRMTVLVCLIVPIITITILFFVSSSNKFIAKFSVTSVYLINCRFLSRRIGYFRIDARPKQNSHCNGCVAGYHRRWLKKNFSRCNVTISNRTHASRATNKASIARIRLRLSSSNAVIWCVNVC